MYWGPNTLHISGAFSALFKPDEFGLCSFPIFLLNGILIYKYREPNLYSQNMHNIISFLDICVGLVKLRTVGISCMIQAGGDQDCRSF